MKMRNGGFAKEDEYVRKGMALRFSFLGTGLKSEEGVFMPSFKVGTLKRTWAQFRKQTEFLLPGPI